MPDIALVVAGLAALALVLAAALKGWQGWLELRRLEIAHGTKPMPARGTAGERIEIADLRERVRKLEAIASYIED